MKRKRRQECCGFCEKCITIGLSITRFRCTRFSRQKVSGKPDAESLGTISKGTIHWVYVMSCEYPGKQRTIVRKSNVKNPHQRSPQRYKNLRTDLKKRLKVNSDAPKARHGIFLKTKTNSKKGTRLHSSRPRKNGYSRLRQQESRRKESLQLIQEQVCTRSVRKALTLLSWRPWRHRGILRRWFPKDPNCDICLKTKITRASCRRRAGTVVPRAEKFGDLKTADHKVLSEGCESRHNHRYAVVVQDLATQWIQSYLMKFLEPTMKPKVNYTDDSLEFGKSCEELSWNHCKSTHTGQKQMGLLREQCVE